ncbi:MAG: lamin tail domain-containing protein, partial [candidate division Zixibacteria bacterium]|nr:lamin tail domain-containing protein [candidate division Zixibacteria bacterium]
MKRNQYFVVILAVSLVQICLANPLPPAELVRVSAYPPEIEIAFNDFPDSLDISGYNIFTSHGIATIDSGTYIYYDENWPGFIVLDSSNTSGFIINQERDSVYTDIEVYGEPVMYGFCYFGIWGRIPPPIKGHSLIVKPYSTYHNWDYRSYGLTFDFSNWDPGFTDVILSEINSHCTWSNDCNFIELYNTSDQDINLSGYKIVCDTIYDLPDNVIIPANGFCVIDEVDFPTGFDMDPGFDNIYLINPDPLWIFDGNRLVDQVGWSSDHA